MIGIKRIEFQQAEGPVSECRLRSFFSWNDVNAHVNQVARTAPADGSYYKCDVRVEWQDGTQRYVRFDMTREHATQPTPVSDEFRTNALFYSGRVCPDRMSMNDYVAFIDNFPDHVTENAKKLLDGGYDFGVLA